MDTFEMGAEYFVRALQDFARSSERKLAELSYEKADLEAQVVALSSAVQAKDRVIREYLKRVALLEFALKRAPTVVNEWGSSTVSSNDLGGSLQAANEVLRGYLREMEELQIGMPDSEVLPPPKEKYDRSVRVSWELNTKLHASLSGVNAVALTDSARVVVGSEDGLVKLWTLEPQVPCVDVKNVCNSTNTCNPNLVLRGHIGAVSALCVSKGLFTGGVDGHIFRHQISRLPDLFPSGSELAKCVVSTRAVAHSGRVGALVHHPVLPLLVSGGADTRICLWTDSLNPSGSLLCDSVPTALTWAADTDLIAGLSDGSVCSFDVERALEKQRFKLSSGVTAAAILQDGLVAVSLAAGTIALMDIARSGQFVSQIDCLATCIATEEHEIYTGHAEGVVRIWDRRALDKPFATLAVGASVRTIASNSTTLVCGDSDGKVVVHRK